MVRPIYMYFRQSEYLLDELRIYQTKYIVYGLTVNNIVKLIINRLFLYCLRKN